MLVCMVTRSDAYLFKIRQTKPVCLGNAQGSCGQCRVSGQGCLECGHLGPARSGERVKVSEAVALMNVPIIQESVVKFEREYHDTFQISSVGPMNTFDISIGWVITVHLKNTRVQRYAKLDIWKSQAIVRSEYYQEYGVARGTCDVIIVGISEDMLDSLEGIRKVNQDA
ncbi:hypothetical protein N7453_011459 [Penicillium expansum]|nr:hypothetical protein N7453_011459 [Penicillium expansum]